jgi:hypothetical protein
VVRVKHQQSGFCKGIWAHLGGYGEWVDIRALFASEKPDIVLLQDIKLRPFQAVKLDDEADAVVEKHKLSRARSLQSTEDSQ